MKVAIVVISATLIGITILPALASGEPAPSAGCGRDAGPVDSILATIRALESGGNYRAQASGSTASGAYQFLNSSWNDYGGYHRAADAPAAVQDAKAAELVAMVLDRHEGDVAAIPVVWYIGHLPVAGSSEWDAVPYPNAGNVLTPREYQRRWLSRLNDLLAASSSDGKVEGRPLVASSCLAESVTTIDDHGQPVGGDSAEFQRGSASVAS